MRAFCFLYFIVFLTLHSEVIDYNGTLFVFIYECSVADPVFYPNNKRGGDKFVVLPFFVATNFTK
jgi:hypothetical protein